MFSLSSDLSVINILINLEVSELTNESCSNQFIFIQKLLQNLLSALDSKMPSLITFLLIFRSSQLHFQVQVSKAESGRQASVVRHEESQDKLLSNSSCGDFGDPLGKSILGGVGGEPRGGGGGGGGGCKINGKVCRPHLRLVRYIVCHGSYIQIV